MIGRTRWVIGAALAVALATWPVVSAGEEAPSALQRRVTRDGARAAAAPASSAAGHSGGWWLGTAGAALALAACGWASVSSRRYLPRAGTTGPAALRVVGRTSLSPRHTVYLLDVGGRVLIVGTGPQGAPSLLGELTDAGGRECVTGDDGGNRP